MCTLFWPTLPKLSLILKTQFNRADPDAKNYTILSLLGNFFAWKFSSTTQFRSAFYHVCIRSPTQFPFLVNALIMFFALFNCGFLVRMYTGLITTQAVRHIDPRPFKSNEIFKVLKEGRYSFIFHSKYYWWYQVNLSR